MFPAQAVNAALSFIRCESGGNPQSISPDGANLGLFQVNRVHSKKVNGDVMRLLEPEENVRVAAMIFRDSGWSPWACRP